MHYLFFIVLFVNSNYLFNSNFFDVLTYLNNNIIQFTDVRSYIYILYVQNENTKMLLK